MKEKLKLLSVALLILSNLFLFNLNQKLLFSQPGIECHWFIPCGDWAWDFCFDFCGGMEECASARLLAAECIQFNLCKSLWLIECWNGNSTSDWCINVDYSCQQL